MNIRFDIYTPELPQSIQDKDKEREAHKDTLQAIQAAKNHWGALLRMPELVDRCYNLDEASDTLFTFKDLYADKIKGVEKMPLPSASKAQMIKEWREAEKQAESHLQALNKALDKIPDGYLSYSDGDPESLCISPKDMMAIEKQAGTIKVPYEAQELYNKFVEACKAIEAFHSYQREKGYNVRHFVDCCMHINSAEDFAKCFINGTWKKYN